MFFIEDNAVYEWDAAQNAYINVGITAKDKVKVVRELESVSVTRGTAKKTKMKSSIPYTLDEIVVKFGVSEEHPVETVKRAKTTK